MATYYKVKLSGSTKGAPIEVTATGTTGANTIHTCDTSTGANEWDEIYLFAHSNDTSDILTIEYGDTDTLMKQNLDYNEGMVPILPGTLGNNSLSVKAYKGSTGSKVYITGWVNQVR